MPIDFKLDGFQRDRCYKSCATRGLLEIVDPFIIGIRKSYISNLLTNVKTLYIIVTVLHNSKQMTVTTESGGRQNMFASEPRMTYVENYEGYPQNAEKLNGRLAMLGIVTGFISYVSSGSFFFFGLLGF